MTRLRIRELGESKGFNMSSLSRASDVSFTTIKRLWQHPEAVANTDTLAAIAKALGVSIAELFEPGEEEK